MNSSEERIPCDDGRCIGTINEEGICNICGKRREKPKVRDRVKEDKQPFTSLSSEKARKTLKERIGDVFAMICGVVLVGCMVCVCFKPFLDDREKIVAVELPGDPYIGLKITECRYPFGSIFNKDEITIGSNGLVITTHSILGGDIKTVPYSKIKHIELAEGMYWKSFTVRREGFWGNQDTIYFKEDLTKDVIKNGLSGIAPGTVIIEKQTAFYRIGKDLGIN
jgi:hypothetical protein